MKTYSSFSPSQTCTMLAVARSKRVGVASVRTHQPILRTSAAARRVWPEKPIQFRNNIATLTEAELPVVGPFLLDFLARQTVFYQNAIDAWGNVALMAPVATAAALVAPPTGINIQGLRIMLFTLLAKLVDVAKEDAETLIKAFGVEPESFTILTNNTGVYNGWVNFSVKSYEVNNFPTFPIMNSLCQSTRTAYCEIRSCHISKNWTRGVFCVELRSALATCSVSRVVKTIWLATHFNSHTHSELLFLSPNTCLLALRPHGTPP
jgi:hypothetical protein